MKPFRCLLFKYSCFASLLRFVVLKISKIFRIKTNWAHPENPDSDQKITEAQTPPNQSHYRRPPDRFSFCNGIKKATGCVTSVAFFMPSFLPTNSCYAQCFNNCHRAGHFERSEKSQKIEIDCRYASLLRFSLHSK